MNYFAVINVIISIIGLVVVVLVPNNALWSFTARKKVIVE